ncbi:MAG: hypothetical protein KA186_09230 [Flavobacteriales bacterium]|nr:hypothetical protein [Flavobacteriales bacterium]
MVDLKRTGAGSTRLAPTPSGFLHMGNAINFLLTEKLARALGWNVRLRIDDLDAERVRPNYVEDVFRSLEWLGITWDEGPSGPADHYASWSQQLRLARYGELVEALHHGGHLYGCTCTRSQLRTVATDGRYPGTCREAGQTIDDPDSTWRLRIPEGTIVRVNTLQGEVLEVDLALTMGDPVVRHRMSGQASGRVSYQIASLADDLDFGITHIVRGADLLPSTACQLHLAKLVGLKSFEAVSFHHHDLVLGPTGDKLSKTEGATSLSSLRARGVSTKVLHRQADTLVEKLLNS